ncbi:MAG TPA: hypothetical protein VK856_12775, partial [Anaerolineaceae bacterium]|nr:hypothetical protein [Anaerolineaceae bacterium]
GLSVDIHPLEMVFDQIQSMNIIPSSELEFHSGKSIIVAGLRISSHRARTTKGELMMFMSMEDLEGMLEVVFFPQIYHQYRQILRQTGPFLVRGVVEKDVAEEGIWIRAEKVKLLLTE